MGKDYQEFKASWDVTKAYRQFQWADKALAKEHYDKATDHLSRGLDLLSSAAEHLAKAAEDAYQKASEEIGKGNEELRKSIDEYSNGNYDRASKYFADAQGYYDKAVDLVD